MAILERNFSITSPDFKRQKTSSKVVLKVQMLVALATVVAATQTLAQPCPKGYKLPPQVAKPLRFGRPRRRTLLP